YGKPPSKENWRFAGRTDIARSNPSEEVTLERAIIRLSNRDWANQVPTASGLVGPTSDKRRCLDLVHRLDDRAWEFIELKIGSDTPLYAAMEILTYGLLYLFSRHHRDEFQYDDWKELLQASLIHLKVLAPSKYYSPNGTGTHYHLKWLEDLLNDGLRRFLDESPRLSLQMPFQFEAFPPDFEWTATTDATRDESVRAALRERRAIYA
ncbi:MAG: hypothetical protein ACE5MM_09690, partial [Nitrospiraceae bacterium]